MPVGGRVPICLHLCLLPLVALNGIPPLLTTAESTRRRPLAPAGLSRQALVETVSSVAQRLELHPLEMDGVSHVLGMLDAVRTTVAAVPEVAKATSSVAASLNGTRNEQAKTSARLDAAFESIQRLSLQIAALQEPLLAGTRDTPPVLVCAEPGTGKTWSAVQLTHALARQCQEQAASREPLPLVPVLVYVQRLSRMLEGSDPTEPLDARTLLQYLASEYADHPEWLSMLMMALEMRTLVVVLDGIDEAAGRKATVSKLIREVLVPIGLRVMCTSRPEGVRKAAFAKSFVIFNLKCAALQGAAAFG